MLKPLGPGAIDPIRAFELAWPCGKNCGLLSQVFGKRSFLVLRRNRRTEIVFLS
jgi:hypothetical protein